MRLYVFDLDGVITDPIKKTVQHPELFDYFVKILEEGNLLTFNTGRPLKFIKNVILSPLEKKISNPSFLSHILAVGEKGGVKAYFKNDQLIEWIDPEIVVSKLLKEKVRAISKEYERSMFFDEDEKTMITLEMNNNYSLEKYKEDQKRAIIQIKVIVEKLGLSEQLKLDPGIIAIDIEDKKVGKHLGVQRILGWLKQDNLKPDSVFIFGDSSVDLQMGDEFNKNGFDIQFIFTGKPDLIKDEKPDFPLQFTKSLYSKGTLEYLSSL